jgi:broad specificity phosphatase PhoE
VGLFGLIESRGPAEIVLVRHGHSVGNLADASAREIGADRLDLNERDADVELSDTGREQAESLAGWLQREGERTRPTLVLSSPYRRAAQTAHLAVEAIGIDVVLEERLRERDLGLFDGLTNTGVETLHPEEAERRRKLGKFYYQPPSGESWCDVALRVRTLLADLREGFEGARVWMFTHQAVIMSFRYVIEGLSEEELLRLDEIASPANASMTTYRLTDGRLRLVSYGDTAAIDRSAAEVTHEPSRGSGDDDVA